LGIAIAPNDRILANASFNRTVQSWNPDKGQTINSPLQHTDPVNCISFSEDGKLLATGCHNRNTYLWDVTAIFKEAGFNDLLFRQAHLII
jgi:WD40 repeat protein